MPAGLPEKHYSTPTCSFQIRTGLYYNPYFPGAAIAMPAMIVDGGVEYDDGTPASKSQQAKVGPVLVLGGDFRHFICLKCFTNY